MIPDGTNNSPKLSPATLVAVMPANGDRTMKPASKPGPRRQAQNRSQGAGAKTVTALSNDELTKAFLTHEEELSLLQSQLALVYKIPMEHGLSRQLLDSLGEGLAGRP